MRRVLYKCACVPITRLRGHRRADSKSRTPISSKKNPFDDRQVAVSESSRWPSCEDLCSWIQLITRWVTWISTLTGHDYLPINSVFVQSGRQLIQAEKEWKISVKFSPNQLYWKLTCNKLKWAVSDNCQQIKIFNHFSFGWSSCKTCFWLLLQKKLRPCASIESGMLFNKLWRSADAFASNLILCTMLLESVEFYSENREAYPINRETIQCIPNAMLKQISFFIRLFASAARIEIDSRVHYPSDWWHQWFSPFFFFFFFLFFIFCFNFFHRYNITCRSNLIVNNIDLRWSVNCTWIFKSFSSMWHTFHKEKERLKHQPDSQYNTSTHE